MDYLTVSIPIPPGLLKTQLRKIQSELVGICPPMAKAAVQNLCINLMCTCQKNCEKALKSIVSLVAAAQNERPYLHVYGIQRTSEFQLACMVQDDRYLLDLWDSLDRGVKAEEIDTDRTNPCGICRSLSHPCSSYYYSPVFSICIMDVRFLGEIARGPTANKDFLAKMERAFSEDPLVFSQRYGIDMYERLRKRLNYQQNRFVGSFSANHVQIRSILPDSSRGKILGTYELGLDLQYFALATFPKLTLNDEEEMC